MMIEIKITLTGCRKLSICADSEGLSHLHSSIHYVASTKRDVMYTSEDWLGELSSKSITAAEGYLCSRFDVFPDSQDNEDSSKVVFSNDGDECYTVGIIATTSWLYRFAHKIQLLIYCSEKECSFEVTSKVIYQRHGEAKKIDEDISILVSKLGT